MSDDEQEIIITREDIINKIIKTVEHFRFKFSINPIINDKTYLCAFKQGKDIVLLDNIDGEIPPLDSKQTFHPKKVEKYKLIILQPNQLLYPYELDMYLTQMFNNKLDKYIVDKRNSRMSFIRNCKKSEILKDHGRSSSWKYYDDNPPPYKTYVRGYIRVSTAEQGLHGFSMEEQSDKIFNEAEKKGYHVIAIYKDEGISGTSIEKREGIKQLMSDAQKDEIIMFGYTNRVARNAKDAMIIADTFTQKGATMIFLDFPTLDPNNPMGKMMYQMAASMAELEVNNTKAKVKAVKDNMGFDPNKTKPRYGYKKSSIRGGEHEIEESEMRVIRMIRDWKEKEPNLSSYKIAERLNKMDIPAGKKGKRGEWKPPNLRKIMHDNGIGGYYSKN